MLLAGSTSLLRSVGCGRKQLHLQGSKVFPNRFYSVDSLWPSASAMRRFGSQVVCSSINCNPLDADDQRTPRKTSSRFSHAQLWCRLERKSVLQLYRARTCAKAIGIQYHSDKDTTTLVCAESGEAFGCLVALRQPNVIIKTGFYVSARSPGTNFM